MKNYRLKVAGVFLGLTAFFIIWGIAGDIDFTEQVILNMTQEQYDSVKHKLKEMNGENPSEREIAHWWVEHHYGE